MSRDRSTVLNATSFRVLSLALYPTPPHTSLLKVLMIECDVALRCSSAPPGGVYHRRLHTMKLETNHRDPPRRSTNNHRVSFFTQPMHDVKSSPMKHCRTSGNVGSEEACPLPPPDQQPAHATTVRSSRAHFSSAAYHMRKGRHAFYYPRHGWQVVCTM
jgi:hypothetical protein